MAKYEIAFDDKREEVSVYLVRNGSCFTNPPEVIQLEPTPYIKPDMELLADEAHEIGFSEGYEQGVKQGRKEMREAVIKLADDSTRICAFDGGSIEYIFRAYKPETILGELAHFDKQKRQSKTAKMMAELIAEKRCVRNFVESKELTTEMKIDAIDKVTGEG